jgi:hypothetical protein
MLAMSDCYVASGIAVSGDPAGWELLIAGGNSARLPHHDDDHFHNRVSHLPSLIRLARRVRA